MRGKLKLTDEDKDWAIKVKLRDRWSCVICNSKERVNAHHIIARENPETKFDINNGISLCPKHHFFCRQVSAHNNPIGFLLWLEKNRPEQLQHARTKMQEILDVAN